MLIVEQISDVTLPPSRKAQRETERENAATARKERAAAAAAASLNAGTKRKRSDLDESDPKLKEFLDIMQRPSKMKTLKTQDDDEEPPTKMQAIEVPEGESDGEYEAVPKKSKKKNPPPAAVPQTIPTPVVPAIPELADETGVESILPSATDDDWLRSRTNRLLDLVDPDEIGVAGTGAVSYDAAQPVVADSMDTGEQDPDHGEGPTVEDQVEEGEKPDPTIEAIKATGRLFVRNLPYSATEDDLREHFVPFGSLEEVCTLLHLSISSSFHDEYPDRDSLCYKHVMRTGRKF